MTQLALRLPDSLHTRAKALAQQDNTSLNQFITMAIAEKVAALETHAFFRERAARGDLSKLDAILAGGPDAPPLPGDEL